MAAFLERNGQSRIAWTSGSSEPSRAARQMAISSAAVAGV
jgi:hypothetical protein